MILDKIVEKTKDRVKELYQQKPLEQWKKEAKEIKKEDFIFYNKIKNSDFFIISEIKKASPSKGIIDPTFNYLEIAKEYKKANVDCISVLTEPYFFQGSNNYIKEVKVVSDLPMLRKDFIIDEIQIYESLLLQADCILLIARILSKEQLSTYLDIAHSLGLSVLVETHNVEEIKHAIESNALLIGVNNRNLQTFEVDITHSINLRKHVPYNISFISESGIKTKEDIKTLKENNINGVLIGETLMKSSNKVALIKEFKNA